MVTAVFIVRSMQAIRTPGSGTASNADVEVAWRDLIQHHVAKMALHDNARMDGRGLLDARPLHVQVCLRILYVTCGSPECILTYMSIIPHAVFMLYFRLQHAGDVPCWYHAM